MKKSEKAAKAELGRKGFVVTSKGVATGNVGNARLPDHEPPTTTLKHGLISRLIGSPPKEK